MNDEHHIVEDFERDGVVRVRRFFTAETVAEFGRSWRGTFVTTCRRSRLMPVY